MLLHDGALDREWDASRWHTWPSHEEPKNAAGCLAVSLDLQSAVSRTSSKQSSLNRGDHIELWSPGESDLLWGNCYRAASLRSTIDLLDGDLATYTRLTAQAFQKQKPIWQGATHQWRVVRIHLQPGLLRARCYQPEHKNCSAVGTHMHVDWHCCRRLAASKSDGGICPAYLVEWGRKMYNICCPES